MTSMEQHPGDASVTDDGQQGDDIQIDQSRHNDSPPQTEKLPMSGVRIIDVGTFLAGPYAASILGEFGAGSSSEPTPVGGHRPSAWP